MKKLLCKIVFCFLGKGFQECSVKDSRIKQEVSAFKDGMVILLKICPLGPCMVLKKENGKIKYMGQQDMDGDISIYFKNTNSAVRILSGRQSISEAYAQHRFLVKGEISQGMILVRCLNIIEGYLFPAFISTKLLGKKPQKEVSSMGIYSSIIFSKRRDSVE